jgi:inorganic pyrophosphatase
MIPQTCLTKENGGDGDPLDIIILGPPLDRGAVVRAKIIGVLYLLDNGEQDYKLIAVASNSPLCNINSIAELNQKYNGISRILEIWFSNYKGPNKMISNGFGTLNNAIEMLNLALDSYTLK